MSRQKSSFCNQLSGKLFCSFHPSPSSVNLNSLKQARLSWNKSKHPQTKSSLLTTFIHTSPRTTTHCLINQTSKKVSFSLESKRTDMLMRLPHNKTKLNSAASGNETVKPLVIPHETDFVHSNANKLMMSGSSHYRTDCSAVYAETSASQLN